MKAMHHLCALFAVLFVLVGCSTNVAPDFRMSAASTTGLAIGSITYTGALGLRRIGVRNIATGEMYRFEVGQSQTLNPFAKPDFDADLGQVGGTVAVELPAGRYAISYWSIRQGPNEVSSTSPIDIGFVVEPGKAVYLGNFHFIQTSRSGLGTGSAEVTYQDMGERDIKALRHRYALLETTPLVTTIEPGFKLEKLGGRSAKKTDVVMPIFVPVKR